MGSGVSTSHVDIIVALVANQQSKPIDTSDITDLENARSEIEQLRKACQLIDIEYLKQNLKPEEEKTEEKEERSPLDEQRGLIIVDMIKEKIDQRHSSLSTAFCLIDTDRSGYISREEFQQAQ
jgi:hypothetical protein